jgi:hypothetical protein
MDAAARWGIMPPHNFWRSTMKFCSLLVVGGLLLSGCASGGKLDTCCDDGFVSLFDGRSFEGWRINENPDSFSVRDGMIIAHGPRSHLFYAGPVENADFRNFHFKAKVKTEPGSNSGIYFHTEYQSEGWPRKGFEAQVNTSHTDRKKSGGLYAVSDVLDHTPAPDGEWYDYEIIVQGRRVVLQINGQTTTDWTQPEDWTPPQHMPRGGVSSGTFALQGHDPKSVVYFKDISVKPLP